jgi:acid phosphatase (class A)
MHKKKHLHHKKKHMNTKGTFTVLPIAAVLVVAVAFAALYFINTKNGRPLLSFFGGSMAHATVDPASIKIPPPPADASAETKAEIAVLLEDKHARATEVVATIQKEATFDAVTIGPYTVGEYRAGKILPKLAKVLSYSLPELMRVLNIKQIEFGRARPSLVDSHIDPITSVPDSSSYPGDYSSQAHFIAHVLSYVDPTHMANYMSYADEISVRQEIAGVQYPLDGAAGAVLGEAFFDILKMDPKFVSLLDNAKTEWAQAGISSETVPQ